MVSSLPLAMILLLGQATARIDLLRMLRRRLEAKAALRFARLPEPDRFVGTCRGEPASIGGEGHCEDRVAEASQVERTGLAVPEEELAVDSAPDHLAGSIRCELGRGKGDRVARLGVVRAA